MAEPISTMTAVLYILLGVLIIAFPILGISSLGVLVGIGIIFIGIWLISNSYKNCRINQEMSLTILILAIIGIIVGIGLIGQLNAFNIPLDTVIYLGAFFLIIAGIIALLLFNKGMLRKWGGICGITLGIIYLVIGIYSLNPIFLAIVVGAFLILTGIFEIFVSEY